MVCNGIKCKQLGNSKAWVHYTLNHYFLHYYGEIMAYKKLYVKIRHSKEPNVSPRAKSKEGSLENRIPITTIHKWQLHPRQTTLNTHLGPQSQQQQTSLPVCQQVWDCLSYQWDKVLQLPIMLHSLLLGQLPHGCCEHADWRDEEPQGRRGQRGHYGNQQDTRSYEG